MPVEVHPNTPAKRPRDLHSRRGPWCAFVRQRPTSLSGPGLWYVPTEKDRSGDAAAAEFAEWLEGQNASDRAMPGAGPFAEPSPDRLALWVRVAPERPLAAFRRAGVWWAVRDLVSALRERPKTLGGLYPALYSVDLGEYDQALSAAGEDNLYLGRCVSDYELCNRLLPVQFDDRDLNTTLTRATQALLRDRLRVPLLSDSDFDPPAPVDGRTSRVERRVSRADLPDYFADMEMRLDRVHDPVLGAFQEYLDELAGQAAPLAEDNQTIASEVTRLADGHGVGLFARGRAGGVRQVRLRSLGPAPTHAPGSPSALAGRFRAQTVGTPTLMVVESVTVPALVAARDLAQAERVFAERDTAGLRPGP